MTSHVTSVSKNTVKECLYDATVSSTCRGNCGWRIVGEKAVVVWLVLLDMEMRCKDVALESFRSSRAGTVNRTFNERNFYPGQNLVRRQ